MPPRWLEIVAWTWFSLAVVSGLLIVADVLIGRRRQGMKVMEWVWPITALYLGPLALAAYLRWGRAPAPGQDDPMTERPHWVRVGISTSHCGAGCTLGDIIAEWLVFWLALAIAGQAIYASFAMDYAWAFALGVVFQFFAITQMGRVSMRLLVRRTLQADLFSLTAFEVGLFVWMGLTWFVFFTDPHLVPTSIVFWFMMQFGMILGFLTSYPANAWLIRRGIKEAM